MLAGIPPNVFIVLAIGAAAAAVLVVAAGLIALIAGRHKPGSAPKRRAVLGSVACLLVAAASWVANIGWVRLILTVIAVPFVHAILFFVTNWFAARHVGASKPIKHCRLWFCLTYLAAYLLLPDVGDTGPAYLLFGLVHSDVAASIGFDLSGAALCAHIVLWMVLLVLLAKQRRHKTAPATEKENTI